MNPDMVALANADPAIIPITQNDILKEQRRDHYCRTMMSDVGKSGTQFEVNRYGLLCRRTSVDRSIPIVIPSSLGARLLFLSHYPQTQGHLGTGWMYVTMPRQYFWPYMASEVQQTVADCRSCAHMRGTQHLQQKKITFFPAAGPH